MTPEYTNKEQRFITRWERQRKNKLKFCIIYGGLGFGVTLSVITEIFDLTADSAPFNLLKLVFRILIFFLVGLFYGRYQLYRTNESRYIELLNEEDDDFPEVKE